MSGRIGGTIEQMNSLGTHFNNQAEELARLVSSISSQLEGTDWQGGAAQRFKDQWNGEFKSVFTKVQQGLDDCASEVRSRATALTQAGG
jgi:WXG100 family type VII secretion target